MILPLLLLLSFIEYNVTSFLLVSVFMSYFVLVVEMVAHVHLKTERRRDQICLETIPPRVGYCVFEFEGRFAVLKHYIERHGLMPRKMVHFYRFWNALFLAKTTLETWKKTPVLVQCHFQSGAPVRFPQGLPSAEPTAF